MVQKILAKNVPEFMRWFNKALNPDIDLSTLYVSDSVKEIFYERNNGEIGSITAQVFFNNLKRNNGIFIEGKKVKVSHHMLAIDDPIFEKWFDPVLNPHIDLSKLFRADCQVKILHKRRDGKIGEITTNSFFNNIKRNNSIFVEGRACKRSSPQLAIDDPVFCEWFDPILNPYIDTSKLYRGDERVKISYKRKDGQTGKITASSFFRIIKRYNGIFVEPKIADRKRDSCCLAINSPIFRKWINLKLNPDIDIFNLSRYDEKHKIKYIGDNGKICSISVKSFFQNVERNGGIFTKRERNKNISTKKSVQKSVQKKITNVMAWEQPAFRKWFNQDLNPDIDPTQLVMQSDVKFRYALNEYSHDYITVKNFFGNVIKHNGLFQPKKDDYVLKKQFVQWFDQTLNPSIDPLLIKTTSKGIYFNYRSEDGQIRAISSVSFFKNIKKNNGKFIPSLKTISGFNDAVTNDPEIELFWDWKKNSKKPTELSPYSGREYYFVCPYCGYEFTKRMKNIAGKSPKCPQCHDEFQRKEQSTKMPSNVAFLLRSLAPKEE